MGILTTFFRCRKIKIFYGNLKKRFLIDKGEVHTLIPKIFYDGFIRLAKEDQSMTLIEKLWKKRKVQAKIISWVKRPEGYYPIFQFMTKEGKKISGVLSQNEILPLEAMPIADSKKVEMIEHLPVENATVIYNVKSPYIFTGYYG